MSSTPSASAASDSGVHAPSQYRTVGIVLAIGSGVLIGSSFVFKKKGLLKSQAGSEAGKGVAYLKSALWWTGMIMMILGELCNFAAYAFVEAIVVTPMGALSVVICAILSSFFLNERLTFFGWIGCFQCIVGSVIIAINAPEEQTVSTIAEFKELFLAPGFLSFGSVVIAAALIIIFFVAPKYGSQHMLWYILVCSLIGGLSVSCTQGLGASIVTTIRGENQFKNWFIYFLIGFVIITLLTEIYFLNVALALFNTAMVTPTYYVIFTFCTLVTSVILYQGLKSTGTQIMTVVLGFLVICSGITLLQMSKVNPEKLKENILVDPKSNVLFAAAREEVEKSDGAANELEADVQRVEEPGIDALRGTFGLAGTIQRVRRMSMADGSASGASQYGRSTPNLTRRTLSRESGSDTGHHQVRRAFSFSPRKKPSLQSKLGFRGPIEEKPRVIDPEKQSSSGDPSQNSANGHSGQVPGMRTLDSAFVRESSEEQGTEHSMRTLLAQQESRQGRPSLSEGGSKTTGDVPRVKAQDFAFAGAQPTHSKLVLPHQLSEEHPPEGDPTIQPRPSTSTPGVIGFSSSSAVFYSSPEGTPDLQRVETPGFKLPDATDSEQTVPGKSGTPKPTL